MLGSHMRSESWGHGRGGGSDHCRVVPNLKLKIEAPPRRIWETATTTTRTATAAATTATKDLSSLQYSRCRCGGGGHGHAPNLRGGWVDERWYPLWCNSTSNDWSAAKPIASRRNDIVVWEASRWDRWDTFRFYSTRTIRFLESLTHDIGHGSSTLCGSFWVEKQKVINSCKTTNWKLGDRDINSDNNLFRLVNVHTIVSSIHLCNTHCIIKRSFHVEIWQDLHQDRKQATAANG